MAVRRTRREDPDRRGRWRRLGLIAGLVLVAPPFLPAQADEARFLRLDQVLPGRCEPEVVQVLDAVDCRFPVTDPTATLDPGGGPYLADLDVAYDDENEEWADCALEGGELVCRAIPGYYAPGRRSVSLLFGWERSGELASYRQVEDAAAGLRPLEGGEPLVLLGRPLRVWAWGEPFAVIRRRDDGRLMATVAPIRMDAEGWSEVPVGALPPGRYRLHPCVGTNRLTCKEVPGVGYFQVGTGRLIEAVPGWNLAGADRVNLVLAGSGFDSFEVFAATARALLAFDGPLLLGGDGDLLPAGAPDNVVAAVEWGPFAVEPLRSARHRFNLWLLADPVADPHALFDPYVPGAVELGGFGLSDVQVTTLHLLAPGRWRRSEASWPSFSGEQVIRRDSALQFAGAYVALPRYAPLWEADVFLHELGHALFDLRDEYSWADREVWHGYPNCAPDAVTAREWWGDLEGAVDPSVYEYTEVMRRYGQWVSDTLVADLTVGYHPGGCYGIDEESAVRPTVESLMNLGTPVFGAVNRRRAEEILALWSGRVPLSDPSHLLSLRCALTADAAAADCEGSLAPGVDASLDALQATAGGAAAACKVLPGEGNGPGRVHCRPVALAGPGPWVVRLEAGGTAPLASVTLAAPPPPTVTSTTTTAAATTTTAPLPASVTSLALPPEGTPAAEEHPALVPVVAALAALAAAAGGSVAWRRRRRRSSAPPPAA